MELPAAGQVNSGVRSCPRSEAAASEPWGLLSRPQWIPAGTRSRLKPEAADPSQDQCRGRRGVAGTAAASVPCHLEPWGNTSSLLHPRPTFQESFDEMSVTLGSSRPGAEQRGHQH